MTSTLPSVITIDGPTASGKGTVAQKVARTLGFHYLDSGSLYRLTAYLALQENIPLNNESVLSQIAAHLPCTFVNNEILYKGNNIAPELRKEEVGNTASKIAALRHVREALLQFQLTYRKAPGLVTDGRDMGTVVFPDATLKVFLTASVAKRAERRYKQLIENGFSANINDLLQDLRARDERDTQRTHAPLVPATGAYIIDTSDMTIEEAVSNVLAQYTHHIMQ